MIEPGLRDPDRLNDGETLIERLVAALELRLNGAGEAATAAASHASLVAFAPPVRTETAT